MTVSDRDLISKCFDAEVSFSVMPKQEAVDAKVCTSDENVPASVKIYSEKNPNQNCSLATIHCSSPISVKWKSIFDLKAKGSNRIIGKGMVLNPFSEAVSSGKEKEQLEFLDRLRGDELSMLRALVRRSGIFGLGEEEIYRFSRLQKQVILQLARDLEGIKALRILTFNPLYIIEQEGLDFLCGKVEALIEKYHRDHPDRLGITEEKISSRLKLHPRALGLALKVLERAKRIQRMGERFLPAGFDIVVSPEEEKILEQMMAMITQGEFPSISLEELKRKFRLSGEKMDRMFTLLIERRKIVLGKDGFLLDSEWLDNLVCQLRESGIRELQVAAFKQMTGLTRKYAIPLLELLDQIGVTKRAGSSRIILDSDPHRDGFSNTTHRSSESRLSRRLSDKRDDRSK